MKIKWFGHASFLIENERGIKIVTDPFDETLGYKLPRVKANIVTVSHEHFDHNFVRGVKGKPVVFKGPVKRESHKMEFRGISSYHDSVFGAQRGDNTIFTINADDLNLCHLGDLGHLLDEDKLNEIGKVDILFIPVGGYYTINHEQAEQIIDKIMPKVIIPMHYKTDAINFSIDPVDLFIYGKKDVIKLNSSEYSINKELLPIDRKIIVFQCQ